MAIREVLTDNRTISPLVPASTANAVGDLAWYDAAANTAKKASVRADTGSKVGNQADFAPLFLGVFADARLAGETTSQRRVVVADGVFDCDCPSRAWKIGEFVGIDRSATPLNLDQQVDVVTQPHLAIGVCVADTNGVAGTKVRARLTGKIAAAVNAIDPPFFGGQLAGSAALADADATLTAASAAIQTGVPTAARKVILPAVAASKGLVFLVVNNSAGANALNVRLPDDSATLQAVAQNKRALFLCDGTTWFALPGA